MIERISPWALREWFVYFGRISPSKIEGLPPTKPLVRKPEATENAVLNVALAKFINAETTWTPGE